MPNRFVLLLSLLVSAAQPGRCASDPGAPQSPPVTLTFVANEGVLLADGRDTVLIDAPFTESYGRFMVPSDTVLEKLRNAAPPYDHLTALLASHGDTDHISVAEAKLHLAKDSGCTFFAPAEVCAALRQLPGSEAVAAQLREAAQTGAPTEIQAGRVTIRAVPIAHLLRPPTMPPAPFNVALLFDLGGIRFLHTGDMGPQNVESMRQSGLGRDRVDVAIVNSYFFEPETIDSARAILAELKPRLVLLAHLGRRDPARQAEPILKLAGFPPMAALDTPEQVYAVVRDGDSVRLEKR